MLWLLLELFLFQHLVTLDHKSQKPQRINYSKKVHPNLAKLQNHAGWLPHVLLVLRPIDGDAAHVLVVSLPVEKVVLDGHCLLNSAGCKAVQCLGTTQMMIGYFVFVFMVGQLDNGAEKEDVK